MAESIPQNLPQSSDEAGAADERRAIEIRIKELRSQISDLGTLLDAHKTKEAGAMAGSVFLALLALLAAYDLFSGKAGMWMSVGVTNKHLLWIAIGLGLAAILCLAKGISLHRGRDTKREETVETLQRELERLLARKAFLESK